MRRFLVALFLLWPVVVLAQSPPNGGGLTIVPPSGGGGGGGGSGCVPSGGSPTNIVLYGTSGACNPALDANVANGALTLGLANTVGGSLILEGSSSGAATLTGGTNGTFTSSSPWALLGLVTLSGASNALGTPLSINLANGTSLPISTGVSGLGANVATALAAAANAPGGFGTVGTSGANVGLLNGNLTYSGNDIFSGNLTFSGLATGTQVSCLGLTSGNAVVAASGPCGSGGGSVSVTTGSPNVVITPSPGTGTFTVGTTNAINTQSTSTYPVGSASLAEQVVRNYTTGAMVDSVAPPTGAMGAGAGFGFLTVTQSDTVTPSSSTVNGLSSIKLGAYQYTLWLSNNGNWNALLGLPQPATQTHSTVLYDDMTWGAPGGASGITIGTTTITGGTAPCFVENSTGTTSACDAVTGSGSVVLATSPTLVTPALGTPSALVGTNITGTASGLTAGTATAANGLNSATTTVAVSAATAPTSGQVLTATSTTAATWQTPTAGSGTVNSGTTGQIAVYAASGTTVSGQTVASGVILKGQGAAVPVASAISDNGSITSVAEGALTTPVGLTDGATIAVNAFLSNNFTVTIAGNRTLSNPTNATAGQWLDFTITQDGTGSRTLAFGTAYQAVSGGSFAVTLNSAAAAVTTFSCKVIATAPTLTCYGPVNSATSQAQVTAPTAPASTTTYFMQGLAGTITPKTTGNVLIIISGTIVDPSGTTAGNGIIYQLSYGTGGAPANAAALTGTQVGSTQSWTSPNTVIAADTNVPFSTQAVVTGLTVGTAYWVDLAAKSIATASSMGVANVSVSVVELR